MEESQGRKTRCAFIGIRLAVAVFILACNGITSAYADVGAQEDQKSLQSTSTNESSESGAKSPKWNSLRSEAIEALSQRDYATAVDKLNQALLAVQSSASPDPDILSEFHHRLALVDLQKGALDDAERECDEALAALLPLRGVASVERAKILNNASVISAKKNQFEKASLQSKKAFDLISTAPDRYALAAIKVNMACYGAHGLKADDSSNLLNQAKNLPEQFRTDPTANAAILILEGLAEYRAGQIENALSKATEATEIAKLPDPMLLVAQNNLAVLFAKNGKLSDAEKLLESAAGLTQSEVDGALIKRNQTKISSFDNKSKLDSLELEFLDPLILVKPERERRKVLVPRPL